MRDIVKAVDDLKFALEHRKAPKPTISIEYQCGEQKFGATINEVPDDISGERFIEDLVKPCLRHLQSTVDEKSGVNPIVASMRRAGLSDEQIKTIGFL